MKACKIYNSCMHAYVQTSLCMHLHAYIHTFKETRKEGGREGRVKGVTFG
jgi:hypothetical protein